VRSLANALFRQHEESIYVSVLPRVDGQEIELRE
jgi:hypothetical protein